MLTALLKGSGFVRGAFCDRFTGFTGTFGLSLTLELGLTSFSSFSFFVALFWAGTDDKLDGVFSEA